MFPAAGCAVPNSPCLLSNCHNAWVSVCVKPGGFAVAQEWHGSTEADVNRKRPKPADSADAEGIQDLCSHRMHVNASKWLLSPGAPTARDHVWPQLVAIAKCDLVGLRRVQSHEPRCILCRLYYRMSVADQRTRLPACAQNWVVHTGSTCRQPSWLRDGL